MTSSTVDGFFISGTLTLREPIALEARSCARLCVLSSPEADLVGTSHVLGHSRVTLGRGALPPPHVRIASTSVGRMNAVFFFDGGRWWVVDRDHHGTPSTNGTWVDGIAATSPLPLRGGELVRVGAEGRESTTLRFEALAP